MIAVHPLQPTVPVSTGPITKPLFQSIFAFDSTVSVAYDTAASKALDKDYYRVTEGFQYFATLDGKHIVIQIPAGYLTDGASVPRGFWWLLPPWSSYGQAAIVHDILCETLKVKDADTGEMVTITRAEADKLFKEAMETLHVSAWKRNLMYVAVRVYAWVKSHFVNMNEPHPNLAKDALQTAWVPTATPNDPTPVKEQLS